MKKLIVSSLFATCFFTASIALAQSPAAQPGSNGGGVGTSTQQPASKSTVAPSVKTATKQTQTTGSAKSAKHEGAAASAPGNPAKAPATAPVSATPAEPSPAAGGSASPKK